MNASACGGIYFYVSCEYQRKEIMAKGKGKGSAPAPQKSTTDRKNGKASKKRPKVFDAVKRRLVTKQ
jgi:hypothetical protein